MSTDDSVSEDVSTSAALSHNNADASGDKESEASVISSEDTLSGPSGPEEDHDRVRSVRALQGFLQSAAGPVTGRRPPAPASGGPKSRSLCLEPQDFSCGRSLPSINPSPLETLRALVEEIRTTGGADPELWKDSEGRWLQLFKLVEKQYQEQILTQQEQYQCQIQLIQDEIKALVQLQNRPIATHPADDSPAHTPSDSLLSDLTPLAPATRDSSNPPDLHGEWAGPTETGSQCLGEGGCGGEERDENPPLSLFLPTLSTTAPPLSEEKPAGPQPHSDFLTSPPSPPANQSETRSGPLTTWAQRERSRRRRRRSTRAPQQETQEEVQEEAPKERSPPADCLDHVRSLARSPQPFYLKQGDTLNSLAPGCSSWRSEQNDLFCIRPDTPDSGKSRLIQESSLDLCTPGETGLSLSLREIYQRKRRETRPLDWSSVFSSKTSLAQVEILHSAPQVRRPRPPSSFTSPFRFSSPSFPTQSRPCPPGGAPVTPESATGEWPAAGGLPASFDGTSRQQGPANMAVTPPTTSPTWGEGVRDGGAYSMPESQMEPCHLNPAPQPRMDPLLPPQAKETLEKSPSLEDPVIMSLSRQSMREKTTRHIADLRAYYESEISALKEKLSLANRSPCSEEKEANRMLRDRCENLERSVMETRSRARDLEEQNLHLERQLSEWQERYDSAGATVTTLQERLEAANQSCREREAAEERLRARVRQLEEATLQAYRLSGDKDARRKQEHRVLQDLLVEYETLGKDHERVKDKLVSTEDKLFDAISQISELKRVVTKLESQVRQLEHESQKTRHASRGPSNPSGAGLYHHPDLLLSPCKKLTGLETSSRKWTDAAKPLDQTAAITTRHNATPEEVQILGGPVAEEPPRRETPPVSLMKALILMEENRSTDGRALPRPDLQGPYSNHNVARRDNLMAPCSEKSSPKRCPSENFSSVFGSVPSWRRHSHTWSDVRLDQRCLMSSSPSSSFNAKKRLQYSQEVEANHQRSNSKGGGASGTEPIERAVGATWDEQGGVEWKEAEPTHPSATPLSHQDPSYSLADTERLFDQLTREKQQIEAALSRLPCSLAKRGTLQAKMEEEALEGRLENLNRELGSLRMTLKKFHVLRSSANI